ANRAIARYRDIEARSGVKFYQEVGCLLTGPKRGGTDGYIGHVTEAAKTLGVGATVLESVGLDTQFPFFTFPTDTDGVFEASGAGHISPRNLVKAQVILAAKSGATIFAQIAVRLEAGPDNIRIDLENGDSLTAEKVLIAAGGFTNGSGLLPDPIDLLVCARTIAYFEVSPAEAERLSAMPSLITKPVDETKSIYMLPPIQYPDGKFYLKTGGDPFDIPVVQDSDMRAWFRTDGMVSVREHLVERTRELLPDLDIVNITSAACVTSYTPTTYPMIGLTRDPRIGVMAGCGGASAKSSDEIGRLGSELMLKGAIDDPDYSTDFRADFRPAKSASGH
ncbi:MAG: hypothetical protein RIR97_1827, partial [Pseudomonadota bacterium]